MMNRQKKRYLLLAAAAAIGAGLFVKNYRIFLNPFQIISYENIEKNKQGICVDENRKLSREELLSRAMASYFDYYRKRDMFDGVGNKNWYEYCRDNGETTKYCWIKKLPEWTITDYLQKSEQIDSESLEKISFVDAMGEMKTFQHPNSYGFLFYSYDETYDFYPHDCCNIKLLSELKPYHFPLENTPEYFQERGIGNYFLNKKMLNFTRERQGRVFNNTYLIDNCGNFATEYYHQGEAETNLKNATTKNIESYWFQQVENLNDINRCKRWKGDTLPIYLIREKLKYRSKFHEPNNQIFFRKDAFYYCF